MVLDRLRRSSRVIAVLLLASFWSLSHRDVDDACATGVFESHDESAHAFGAARDTTPDHCAVCHAARSPRRSFGPAGEVHAPRVPGTVVVAPDTVFRRAPARDNLPARAPPATLI